MKNALITGGSGAIGQAIAKRLIEDGYKVTLQYMTKKGAADCDYIFGDFSTLAKIKEFIAEAFKGGASYDAVINNAGRAFVSPLDAMTDEEIEEIINIDLTAAVLITRNALKPMLKNKRGNIVNISSVWGVEGGSCEVAYSAAKGGLISMTKALAKEVGQSGIRVNCIAPSLIDTPMNSSLTDADRKEFLEGTAFSRVGTPKDVAEAVAFLVSDKASYISGQTIILG